MYSRTYKLKHIVLVVLEVFTASHLLVSFRLSLHQKAGVKLVFQKTLIILSIIKDQVKFLPFNSI